MLQNKKKLQNILKLCRKKDNNVDWLVSQANAFLRLPRSCQSQPVKCQTLKLQFAAMTETFILRHKDYHSTFNHPLIYLYMDGKLITGKLHHNHCWTAYFYRMWHMTHTTYAWASLGNYWKRSCFTQTRPIVTLFTYLLTSLSAMSS